MPNHIQLKNFPGRGVEVNLFAVIPERFFSVLASPLKQDYAAILFRIYDQYQLTTFGMERDVVIDLIVDYIEQKDGFFEQALADEIWEESLDTPAGPRERAAFILRKLEATGWVVSEVYSNYVQYISLPDYAIKILDVLDKIRRHRQVEYQGYVMPPTPCSIPRRPTARATWPWKRPMSRPSS